MIKISNLQKSFNENKVLESINLTINDGEIFGLVGESGAGKPTLLNCINRLEIYEESSLIVDNTAIESLDEIKMREFRKNIGMIFQNVSLVNRKNVYRNIALPMEYWGFSKSEIDQKVRFLDDKVVITDKFYSKLSELSGGQKQRMAIARALTMNPKYLLSDESTSSLDPNTTLSILNLLKYIRNEIGSHYRPPVSFFGLKSSAFLPSFITIIASIIACFTAYLITIYKTKTPHI